MRSGDLAPFGGGGGIVESDETFIGIDPDEPRAKAGGNHKMKVLTLLDRTTGRAHSTVLDFISAKAIGEIVVANLSKEAVLIGYWIMLVVAVLGTIMVLSVGLVSGAVLLHLV